MGDEADYDWGLSPAQRMSVSVALTLDTSALRRLVAEGTRALEGETP